MCYTLQVINDSAQNNKALVLGDDSNGTVIVRMYDWQNFLGQLSQRIDQIFSYHQFTFTGNGQVDVCKFVGQDPGPTTDLIIHLPECDQLPTVIPIEGLSVKRQWYLYEAVREFCKEEFKDPVCPKPCQPKSSATGRLMIQSKSFRSPSLNDSIVNIEFVLS